MFVQKNYIRYLFITLSLYILLSYILLYYSYKFYSPDFGGTDFYHYYKLYTNLSISETEAPFNMRLISPFFVFLLNKTGLFYHTFIHYHNINIQQQVFFNAIFLNWIASVITAVLIFHYLQNKFPSNFLLNFTSGLIYLFSFGTILFCINPNTDGFSIMLISIYYIQYKKKSWWVYLLYPVLLFQREFAFIIFALIAFFDSFICKKQDKYYLLQLLLNVAFFLSYYILRKTIFYTSMYSNQITESQFVHNLFNIPLNWSDFIKQAFLTQNIFIFYLFLLLINFKERWQSNKISIFILLVFIIVTFIISRIAVANNNMGRFLHMFSPILIIEILYPEMLFFIKKFCSNYTTS